MSRILCALSVAFASLMLAQPADAILAIDYRPNFNVADFGGTPGAVLSVEVSDNGPDGCFALMEFDEKGRLLSERRDGIETGWGDIEYYVWKGDRLLSSSATGHGSDVSFFHRNSKYTYDSKNRIVQETREFHNTVPPAIVYREDGINTYKYSYDSKGNLVRTTVTRSGRQYSWEKETMEDIEPTTFTVDFTYDASGRVVGASMKSPEQEVSETYSYSGKTGTPSKIVVNEYNPTNGTRGTIEYTLGASTGTSVRKQTGKIVSRSGGYSNTDGFSVTFSPKARDTEALHDIDNPHLACNKGDETLHAFMHRFTTDRDFRTARSQGMLRCGREMTVARLLKEYDPAATGKPLVLTDRDAVRKLGDYATPPYARYRNMFPDDGIYYGQKWRTLDANRAVLAVTTRTSGNDDKIQEYVFVRKGGKWRLAGRIDH